MYFLISVVNLSCNYAHYFIIEFSVRPSISNNRLKRFGVKMRQHQQQQQQQQQQVRHQQQQLCVNNNNNNTNSNSSNHCVIIVADQDKEEFVWALVPSSNSSVIHRPQVEVYAHFASRRRVRGCCVGRAKNLLRSVLRGRQPTRQLRRSGFGSTMPRLDPDSQLFS